MRKDIINIVADIVESIDKNVQIRRVEDFDLPNTKLFYECGIKWLKDGDLILDNQLREARVTSIGDGFITIFKSVNFDWDSPYFTLTSPIYYFKGTPLATNSEWKYFATNEDAKTPFVWLVNPITETFHENDNSPIERESELRLYFLDKTNFEKYTVQQHHDEVIKYLNDWVDGFFLAIRKNIRDFVKVDTYKSKNLSLFGTETPKGFESVILDSKLSAVEIRFTLTVRKGAKCLC